MIDHADVMVIGIGDLGGWVVEFLVRLPGMEHKKILIAGKNEETVRKRTFSAWGGTSFVGLGPEMAFARVDLFNLDETGELLARYKPEVICSCAALQPWWIVSEISEDVWSRIERGAGFGPWSPFQLTLIYKLMQAIQESEIRTLVVNCSFPDFTNPVLGRVGLAPTCGIGNGDLVLPGIRRAVAKKLNAAARNIALYPVMHHSHVTQFMMLGKPGSPYYLKIMVGDRDVTNQFDTDELILAGIKDWFPGRHSHPMTASSAVKNIWHLLFDTGELTFAPGPSGEVGGYPVRMSASGVQIVLPEGVTMDEARRINEDAQKNDGVERIEQDGTVVFTDAAYSVMKEFLGYDCKTLKLEECEERSKELLLRYGELKKKYGRS